MKIERGGWKTKTFSELSPGTLFQCVDALNADDPVWLKCADGGEAVEMNTGKRNEFPGDERCVSYPDAVLYLKEPIF